jgi:RNA polymerase sigma factor (sigma-70 family)
LDRDAFMQACRDGGRALATALRLLDHHYFGPLYRESFRVLRDGDAAMDVVQETFIKVWQRCRTYRGDAEVLPWMRGILRYAILDRLRRRGRENPLASERLVELDGVGTGVVADTPGPEESARRAELEAVFERCWRRFEGASPTHAAVLSWVVEDGLSHEEIAALLERTPGATREFISQCRKRARLHLAEWYALALPPEIGS